MPPCVRRATSAAVVRHRRPGRSTPGIVPTRGIATTAGTLMWSSDVLAAPAVSAVPAAPAAGVVSVLVAEQCHHVPPPIR